MFCSQFLNLLGEEISTVGDRIVVKHAGKRCRFEHGGNMRLHFAFIALINIGRQTIKPSQPASAKALDWDTASAVESS